jgi:hypothetical protein
VRPGGALPPPPRARAPCGSAAAGRGRGAEGGARLGVRVVPPGCGRPSAPRPAAGGRGGPIVHAYKQFEKIGKKTAHIGKLVHVPVLFTSAARFFPGISMVGRGDRIRALRLFVLETGTNGGTRRARFSFYLLLLLIINY